MDEIIVICASDSDGSLFQTVIDALREKSGKAVHIGGPEQSVLTVGEIEIHPASHQVFKAGIEVHLNQIDQSNLSHNLKQSYYITINEQNTTYCVIFVTTINLMAIKLTAIKIAII